MDDDSRSPTPREEADEDRPPSRDVRARSQSESTSTIDVIVLDPRALVTDHTRATLRDLTIRALTHARARGEVRIKLVDDDEMVRAHARSHDDPTTTDVITYDLRDDDTDPLDTDLIVCADEARRRARELDHPIEHELTLYAIHGALHCLGYDDTDETSRERIHAREDELLGAIGIGPVYAKRENGAPS